MLSFVILLSVAVCAAFGGVYKSDPTPNPSLGRGLSQRDRVFCRNTGYDYEMFGFCYASSHFLTSSIEGAFSPSLFFLLNPHRSLKNLPGASLRSDSTVRYPIF